MIETINEQHIEIVNRMREYDLSRETDLRFNSARLDVKFCDDGASFPPLESRLEEVLDPSPTTLPLLHHPHLALASMRMICATS